MMVSSRDYRLTIFIEKCVIFVVLEFVYFVYSYVHTAEFCMYSL